MEITVIITAQTLIALFGHISPRIPVHNLPIFLYGLWATQHHDTLVPLRQYLLFLGISILLDIVWMANYGSRHDDEGTAYSFGLILCIFNLLLKPLSLFWTTQVYRRRGGDTYGLDFGISGSNLRGPIALGPEATGPSFRYSSRGNHAYSHVASTALDGTDDQDDLEVPSNNAADHSSSNSPQPQIDRPSEAVV